VATLDQTNGIWPDPGLLKQLKDSRIVLLQDSRDPYALEAKNLPVIIRTMESGDIGILGLENRWAVEAKWSIEDLAACVGFQRPRFEKELRRLASHDFARILILGSEQQILRHEYRSEIAPAAILGSLNSWQMRWKIPYSFCSSLVHGDRATT
jgi:DNA excision repair protein ERCC-4